MRTLIRDNDGEVMGERWILTEREVKTITVALDYHGESDTLGRAPAADLRAKLNENEPDPNSAALAPSPRAR